MTQKKGGPHSIGTLSKETGVHIETIRYYERKAILPEPSRGPGNQRQYADGDIRRLTFIRRARELDFTLKTIASLLGLVETANYTCAEVRSLTLQHASEVGQKIVDLRRMEAVLLDMASSCEAGDLPDCPIVDALFEEN